MDFKKAFFSSLGGHAALFIFLAVVTSLTPSLPLYEKKKLTIRTIALTPTPSQKTTPPITVVKEIPSSHKKMSPSSPSKIDSSSTATASPTRIKSPHTTALIQAVKESMAQLEHVEEILPEEHYRDLLTSVMQTELKLPEEGVVNVRIVVEKSGNIKKVEVLKSKSKLNSEYMEKKVPSLKLPPFSGKFAKYTEYTFFISFCS